MVKEKNSNILNVAVALGILVLFVAGVYYFSASSDDFSYRGMTGNVVREGNLILYQTSIPVKYQGDVVPYNFYLRNSPSKLDKIPFNGDIDFRLNVAFKSEKEFNCDGDGIIGVANLAKLYEITGAKVIKDENATCDPEGRYMLINIKEGNETRIDQVGPACYEMQINNCEILATTERFMTETLVALNKIKESS